MFLGREPCNENFPSGSAIASDGKNIEYSRRLAENFRLRNVGACLPFRKFTSETTVKKGSTKHCCWGNCKNYLRYPDKLPSGTYFIRFPKPGNVKESMTLWEKDRENVKTEKDKKWVHACGREGFSIKNIKKDTFICSNDFIGCCGPTEEDPDPLLATLTDKELGSERTRKQKNQETKATETTRTYSSKGKEEKK